MPREYVNEHRGKTFEEREKGLQETLEQVDQYVAEKDSKTLDSIYKTLISTRDGYLSTPTETHKRIWQKVIDHFLEKRAELKK